jgi:dimethylhistidine N-methyltransferase
MRNESPTPQHHPEEEDFLAAVCAGLRRRPKSIPPKYFYDAHGSRLFDLICTTPEYYPTRTETAILERCGAQMAGMIGPSCMLIELGSGSAIKTPLLLRHLNDDSVYVPIDICEPHLLQSTRRLQTMFPSIRMQPLCADYTLSPAIPSDASVALRRVVFFPGSTIGNYAPDEAVQLLKHAARLCGNDGALLIGVDRKKSPDILNAAYNDAAGHTAAFNLNLLTRMQRELGALLDPGGFVHHAFYNAAEGRIEMHLVSHRRQSIRLDGRSFRFEQGESIHTENSYKYTTREFEQLARKAEWHPKRHWSDPAGLFDVHYFSLSAGEPRHLPHRPK